MTNTDEIIGHKHDIISHKHDPSPTGSVIKNARAKKREGSAAAAAQIWKGGCQANVPFREGARNGISRGV